MHNYTREISIKIVLKTDTSYNPLLSSQNFSFISKKVAAIPSDAPEMMLHSEAKQMLATFCAFQESFSAQFFVDGSSARIIQRCQGRGEDNLGFLTCARVHCKARRMLDHSSTGSGLIART
jgi:hypothetical protein